jgi:hypothetical protein
MQTKNVFGLGALLYGVALFVIGNAEAFPVNNGHGSIRAVADDAAHALVIQAQCGPSGCPPSGARQPPYVGDDRPQRGISREFIIREGIGIGTDIITEQLRREQRPRNSDYAENFCGKKGMVPQFLPSGKFKCVVVSDARLKRDIAVVGRLDNGIGLYRFRYLWSDAEYVGVLAQEVAKVRPDALLRGTDGYLRVDYARLGTRMMTWREWTAAH